ncbi:hypothetical protein Pcinc_038404 [Petrolisthes cinctipes]|uniref:Uncharacterized protein n=1 Tax=Petrolisthes cinctipes TaxID=88211 RepID=A0AAE1BQL9_PETCI|nr:hypothetical protein Pcinc_038404 [Petrolisthes cinctipes]
MTNGKQQQESWSNVKLSSTLKCGNTKQQQQRQKKAKKLKLSKESSVKDGNTEQRKIKAEKCKEPNKESMMEDQCQESPPKVKGDEEDEIESESIPTVDVVFSNVVSSFYLGRELNLVEIAREAYNVELKPNGALEMALRRPPTVACIWSSGKVTCTGHYEPELSLAVTYKIEDPKATLKVFNTGSVTITASKIENILKAIEHVYPIAQEFKRIRNEREEDDFQRKQERKFASIHYAHCSTTTPLHPPYNVHNTTRSNTTTPLHPPYTVHNTTHSNTTTPLHPPYTVHNTTHSNTTTPLHPPYTVHNTTHSNTTTPLHPPYTVHNTTRSSTTSTPSLHCTQHHSFQHHFYTFTQHYIHTLSNTTSTPSHNTTHSFQHHFYTFTQHYTLFPIPLLHLHTTLHTLSNITSTPSHNTTYTFQYHFYTFTQHYIHTLSNTTSTPSHNTTLSFQHHLYTFTQHYIHTLSNTTFTPYTVHS